MGLADNSDSDSDDESSIGRRVSEDFENEEFVDFGNSEIDSGDAFESEDNDENFTEETKNNTVGEAQDIQNKLLMDQDMSDDEEEEDQDDCDIENDPKHSMDTTEDNEDDILQQNLLCDQDISDDDM